MQKLTEKQKRFCDYYIETGNATESYKRAGYKCNSENVYNVNASRLLINAKIKLYIDNKIANKDNKRIASQDEVLEFLTSVQRGEVMEEIVCPDGMGGIFRQDKIVSVTDRIKAATMLAKRYGLDKCKAEIEDSNIKINITDSEEDED